MSGQFNLKFYHGLPAVDSWQTLFRREKIVRMLPKNEMDEASKVINGVVMNEDRYNVNIRWHELHYDGCPRMKARKASGRFSAQRSADSFD